MSSGAIPQQLPALPVHAGDMPFVPPQPRRRPFHRLHVAALLVALLVTVEILCSHNRIPKNLSISQQCRMSRMWPSYVLHHPNSPSGLVQKYSLYLYQENEPSNRPWEEPKRTRRRRPAIFVPGNAASYGQIRSVASWSHRNYKDRSAGGDPASQVWSTDWWTLDFNEDFSAFHAPTLEAQAFFLNEVISYIVAYYQDEGLDSIPILAHSMGGVVARLALTLPNQHDLRPVKTIITLSTPHTVPPAPMEAGLEEIYSRIEKSRAATDLEIRVLLVSLSGGVLDTQLPSELTYLSSSSTHVLQGYTTNLPGLWSGVDHLAMMWCDQLRRKISWVVDEELNRGQREDLVSKEKRWQRALGVQGGTSHAFTEHPRLSLIALRNWLRDAPSVVVSAEDAAETFPVPNIVGTIARKSDAEFQLITNLAVGSDETVAPGPVPQDRELNVFVCKQKPDSKQKGEQICSPLPPWSFNLLPPSSVSDLEDGWTSFPRSETFYEQPGNALRFLRLQAADLRAENGWDNVKVIKDSKSAGDWRAVWVTKELPSFLESMTDMPDDAPILLGHRNKSSSTLAFALGSAQSSSHPSMLYRRWRLPQVDSTLFIYDFTFLSTCEDGKVGAKTSGSSAPLFAPLVHVYSVSSGDGRWYPSLSLFTGAVRLPVHVHSTSPFVPLASHKDRGVVLELFSDETRTPPHSCATFGDLQVRINWRKSYGLWLARLRWGVLSWCFAPFGLLAASLLSRMMETSLALGNWNARWRREIQGAAGMSASLSDDLMQISTILTTRFFSRRGAFPMILATVFALNFLKRFIIIRFGLEEGSEAARNLLFGLTGESGIAFGFLSSDLGLSVLFAIGLVMMSWVILTALSISLSLCSFAAAVCLHQVGGLTIKKWLSFEHDGISATPLRYSKSTIAVVTVLTGLIKVAVPYPFVLTAIGIAQFLNVVRAQLHLISNKSPDQSLQQTLARFRFHQNFFFLLYLVLLLPLKAPILLVFVRNFLAGYLQASPPGGSTVGEDHTLWKILPWLALVQVLATGRCLEIQLPMGHGSTLMVVRRLWLRLSVLPLCLSLAAYAVAWGVRYPYRIYDISTLLVASLLVAHYAARWQEASSETQGSSGEPWLGRSNELKGNFADGCARPELIPLSTSFQADSLQSAEESTVVALPSTLPDEFLDERAVTKASDGIVSSNAAIMDTEESGIGEGLGQHTRSDHVEDLAASTSAAEKLEARLEHYLDLVEQYATLHSACSKQLSKGFYNLSAAQMGSFAGGGWTQGSWSEQRRRAFLASELGGAEGGRQRELGVEIEADEAGVVTCSLQHLHLYPQPTIVSDEDEPGMLVEKDADAIQNISEERAGGLRQRRNGAASSDTVKAEGDKAGESDRDDERNKGHAISALPATEAQEQQRATADRSDQGKPRSRRPTALERFSPLPPVKLKRARDCFLGALDVIASGKTTSGESVSSSRNGRGGQKAVWKGPRGIMGILVEMHCLEQQIAKLRKKLEEKEEEEEVAAEAPTRAARSSE